MMDKAIAVQMFNDISRRAAKLAEGRGEGTLKELAATASKVGAKISAFMELKESGTATSILSAGEKLSAELESLKTQTVHTGLVYEASLTLAMDEICGVTGDVALSPLGREIRERVLALDPTKRLMFVQDAIKTKNGKILAALLYDDLPSLLTGIIDENKTQLKLQLHKLHAAHLYATREAAADALALVESALGQALQIVTSTLAMPALHIESAKSAKRAGAEAVLSV